MENITMITTAIDAAPACATDDVFGGFAGVLSARDRIRVTGPKTAFVSDPRLLGPPV
ncbi:hypothetical protein O9K63_16405 [Janibacter cremeus]|uniref:hypothetical protein n=1 Tax=Janibacter cremeus TaxID=1285192 RepID=UPI0023F805EC|nr:hypothetical protein [Janibacter cremeus]WEV78145.1 hypothetical protein O9K63_16405 [Janibacter cremeus]